MTNRMNLSAIIFSSLLIGTSCFAAQKLDKERWWLQPHRMLQTNLREIDADMNLDEYIRDVKGFGADTILFNVGGIVANYPTDVEGHFRNTYMKGDLVGAVLERLHKENIRMVARFDFSKVNEAYAAQHADWLYVGENGQTVNYNGQVQTCVSGGYQQDVMFKILGEAVDRYPVDGVFFNMIGYTTTDYSGNDHGICQCANCQRLFKEFCGLPLPRKGDGNSAAQEKYRQFTAQMVNRQFTRVHDFLKARRSDLMTCTYVPSLDAESGGTSSSLGDGTYFTGLDVMRKESGARLGSGTYHDTDQAKWTRMAYPDQQLANASVYFRDMPFRHSAVAPNLVVRRLWQQAMNGAWLDFYIIGPLARQEDRTGLEGAGDVFRFHAQNERLFRDSKPGGQVGLIRQGGAEYHGIANILSENQVAYELAEITDASMATFDLVIVPEGGGLDQDQCAILDRYVEAGGRLLLTGKVPTGLKCLSAAELVETRPTEKGSYIRIRPEDRSILHRPRLEQLDLVYLNGPFNVYKTKAPVEGLLRLIPGDMFGPPEKCYYRTVSDSPALLFAESGKGKVACFSFGIGAHYNDQIHQGHAQLVLGTIDSLLGLDRSLRVETHPLVEITHRKGNAFEWVGLYNHTGQRDKALHAPIPISDIRMTLRPKQPVATIKLLKAGSNLKPTTDAEGRISVTIPRLDAYDLVVFEYATPSGAK